jgi:uncharacterized protein YjiS (DUF1127 family)
MQIIEQPQGDQMPSMLEPRIRVRGGGSPRCPVTRESSSQPFRRAMSWLGTVMIESLAASAQAMYPVCLTPGETDEEDAEPALQNPRLAEPGNDPAWSHGTQTLSFDDWLATEKISTGSFGWSTRVRARAVRLWSTVCRARQRRRAIVELEALDDRTLKDIGIHRSHIESVVEHGNFYE